MVAKIIMWGKDRNEAIQRMKRALSEFEISGIKTTIPFHLQLLEHEAFINGDFNTKFLDLLSINIQD